MVFFMCGVGNQRDFSRRSLYSIDGPVIGFTKEDVIYDAGVPFVFVFYLQNFSDMFLIGST